MGTRVVATPNIDDGHAALHLVAVLQRLTPHPVPVVDLAQQRGVRCHHQRDIQHFFQCIEWRFWQRVFRVWRGQEVGHLLEVLHCVSIAAHRHHIGRAAAIGKKQRHAVVKEEAAGFHLSHGV